MFVSGRVYTCLEPKRPLFWLEKALFWRVQPLKQRTNWVPGVYIYIMYTCMYITRKPYQYWTNQPMIKWSLTTRTSQYGPCLPWLAWTCRAPEQPRRGPSECLPQILRGHRWILKENFEKIRVLKPRLRGQSWPNSMNWRTGSGEKEKKNWDRLDWPVGLGLNPSFCRVWWQISYYSLVN